MEGRHVQASEQDTLLFKWLLYVAVFAVGFLARSLMQWALQKAQAREALIRAFSTPRAEALRALWAKTIEFSRLDTAQITDAWRDERNRQFTKWYYDEAGALFLSWKATRAYFRAINTLRKGGSGGSQDSREQYKDSLQRHFSKLRTQLKWDIGIYSSRDTLRQLDAPTDFDRAKPLPVDIKLVGELRKLVDQIGIAEALLILEKTAAEDVAMRDVGKKQPILGESGGEMPELGNDEAQPSAAEDIMREVSEDHAATR
jgi:hypothetical protein